MLAVALVIVCVVLIFIAPTLDLPQAHLRARHLAQSVLLAVCVLLAIGFSLSVVAYCRQWQQPTRHIRLASQALLCAFLC